MASLLAVDASYDALQLMALDDADPRIRELSLRLSRLRKALETRFPEARRIVRPGFDEPVT
jgi:hypothetical protein